MSSAPNPGAAKRAKFEADHGDTQAFANSLPDGMLLISWDDAGNEIVVPRTAKQAAGLRDIIDGKDAEIKRFKAWLNWAHDKGLFRLRLDDDVPWVIRALDGEDVPT